MVRGKATFPTIHHCRYSHSVSIKSPANSATVSINTIIRIPSQHQLLIIVSLIPSQCQLTIVSFTPSHYQLTIASFTPSHYQLAIVSFTPSHYQLIIVSFTPSQYQFMTVSFTPSHYQLAECQNTTTTFTSSEYLGVLFRQSVKSPPTL